MLKQFRDKARDGAVSKKLRAEHEQALAARSQTTPLMATPSEPRADAVAVGDPPTAKQVTDVAKEVTPTATVPPAPVHATRYVPVSVTRCVPVLAPVTYYTTRGCVLRRTSAVTHYEWRNQLVTETVYAPVVQ